MADEERCRRCDDPECLVPEAEAALARLRIEYGCAARVPYMDTVDALRIVGAAKRDCATRPAVDWRARALAAEALAVIEGRRRAGSR